MISKDLRCAWLMLLLFWGDVMQNWCLGGAKL